MLIQTLDELYALLPKKVWPIDDFLSLFDDDFHKRCIHDVGLTEQYRLAAGKTKKFHDEIMPMVDFLRKDRTNYKYVSMSLSDDFPDAKLTDNDGHDKSVEITATNAKERRHLANELNNNGIGRGFIGIDDDSTEGEFKKAISKERAMFSPKMVEKILQASIAISLRKKSKYKADILLISYHRFSEGTLPSDSWKEVLSQLKSYADQSNYGEIFLVGEKDDGWVHQLK